MLNNKHKSIKAGTKLTAIKTIKTDGILHFVSAVTGSFKCVIAAGTEFIVADKPNTEAQGFYVLPLNIKEFERFITKEDLENEFYSGYSFVFMYSKLGEDFEIK